ncbi:MAG TPA: hypothetical protein VF559_00035 [Caulobacteraceae bacterium]|jgi:hypothetical protein
MFSVSKSRLRAATAAVVLAAFAAAPAIAAAEASAPSQVGVAQRVIDSASAYQAYVAKTGALKADFADGASVRSALVAGASYQPDQLQEGEVAYAALLALQDAAFVNAVRGYAAFPGAADKLADQLAVNPDAVFDLPAANDTAAKVSAELRDHGFRILTAGKAVKQSAYDMQHAAWSQAMVSDGPTRLTNIKAMSQARFTATADDTARLINAVTGDASSAPAKRPSAKITKTAARGLAIAALAVMGKASQDSSVQLAALLSQPGDGQCLKMAKLNLYQCLASAGPQYEDVFCLGEHALKDTGFCVMSAAGEDPVEKLAANEPPAPPVAPGVMIPVASVPAPAVEPAAPASPLVPVAMASAAGTVGAAPLR